MPVFTYSADEFDTVDKPLLDDAGVPRTFTFGRRAGNPMVVKVENSVMWKVKTVWGAKFPKGEPVEVTDPKLIAKLRTMKVFTEGEGKKPIDAPPPHRGDTATSEADFKTLGVAALRAMCKERGFHLDGYKKKAELVNMLVAANG